ncbi:MAG: carboxyl-terminal processing protease [Acidobacteriota bacterium]|nr:carboxyl-terminal processing protease [Acidobacteriota bacterium]
MKNRLSRYALAPLAIVLGFSIVFAQQTAPRRGEARTTPNTATPPRGTRATPARPAADATGALEEDFAEALSIVQDNYVDGVKLDYNTVFKSSIIGMLRTLDPHSNYYDSKEFEELQTDWRSEYFGVGASIINHAINNGQTDTFILATFENSPAARAGLRYGDKILEVDGKSTKGKLSAEVRDWIRGPKGSTVKILLERAATGVRETVEVVRDTVPQPTVPDAYMIKPGVGYISITQFNRTTAEEFIDGLENLHKQGMTQLVLDLRNNPGGLLDQAVKVAERFLGRGQLVLSQRGRIAGVDRSYNSTNSTPDGVPLVVLVNRNTASASEIVAGALQDHDRALVIGETSFGKGLVQSIIPMDYGTALTLTSTKYYTPSGRLIQRDYSNEGLYDYYTKGQGLGGDDNKSAAAPKPTGPESLTDTGRKVYGGGGISPDDAVKPRLISPTQQRLFDPIFGFVRELVSGRVRGFEDYKLSRGIEFNHVIKTDEYPVTDNLFKAFKAYALADESYKLTDAGLDKARDYISRQLRFEIGTAAYGTVAAAQVNVADDPQVTKAIDALPRARELAAAAQRGRNPQTKTFE